jgi:quercetin dioxygenase-like cupin family protein
VVKASTAFGLGLHYASTVKIVRVADIRRSAQAAVFVGRDHAAQVSFFIISNRRGEGPGPHRHPYEETFVMLDGAAEFTVDDKTVEVGAGYIVVVPAGAVHSFKGASDGVTRQVNIHPVAEMVTEWLD